MIAAMSEQQFLAAVHGQLVLPGGKKLWRRIALAVHAAAAEPGGTAGERAAMVECAAFAFADWMSTPGALADAESRMLAVLDELGLTGLVTTFPACRRWARR